MKKQTLILLGTMVICTINAQHFRVKKITDSEGNITTLNYTDSLLTSYTEFGRGNETFQLTYDKNKITIASNQSKNKEEIKFNKQGQVEKIRNIELKYDKDGTLNWYKEKDPHGQWTEAYKLLYDENNLLKTIFKDKGRLGYATLLFYNDNNKCTRALAGSYIEKWPDGTPHNYDNDIIAVWEGNKIKTIDYFDHTNSLQSRLEFEYNANGLVSKERSWRINTSTKELELDVETTIEYEEGIGNEDLTYLRYRNTPFNIPFGINAFTFYKYIYM